MKEVIKLGWPPKIGKIDPAHSHQHLSDGIAATQKMHKEAFGELKVKLTKEK